MIKLNVIDLVWRFCLESLVDYSEFSICDRELHEVENRSEPGVCNKSTVGLVFVLEEWLDK